MRTARCRSAERAVRSQKKGAYEARRGVDEFARAATSGVPAVFTLARLAAVATAAAFSPDALKYLNRLSDHLFVLARWVARERGGDILWQPGATREG